MGTNQSPMKIAGNTVNGGDSGSGLLSVRDNVD